MIRKFAAVPRLSVGHFIFLITVLTGTAALCAQQPQPAEPAPAAPAQQQTPAAQQPSDSNKDQEASVEESTSVRKKKPKEYKNWSYNVGGGASLTNGATANFVRGGGGIAAVGVARNYSQYFGFRLDFQFDNLPLRSSALLAAQAPGATEHVYTLTLDPIINLPVSKTWGGYILGGAGYFHRSGKLDSSSAIPGSACNSFFT